MRPALIIAAIGLLWFWITLPPPKQESPAWLDSPDYAAMQDPVAIESAAK